MTNNNAVIIFLAFVFGLLFLFVIFLPVLVSHLQFKKLPKKVAQVKVIKKKFKSSGKDDGGNYYFDHFVIFKFFDNSEKEFYITRTDYDSIRENDKGTLVYKEREEAIKRNKYKKSHYEEREFISFKKDN